MQLRRERLDPRLRFRERRGRLGGRVDARVARVELGAGGGGAREELVVGLAPEPALGVRDPLELRLDVLQAVGLRLERVEEPAEVGADVGESQLQVAQLGRRCRELWREPLERRDRALRPRREQRGSVSVLRRQRLGGRCRALGKLRQMAQALPLGEQRRLSTGLEPVRVLHQRLELGEPGLRGSRVGRDLVVAPPGGGELAPRTAQVGAPPEVVVAHVRVEHLELVPGAGKPSLLELARHPDQELGRGREILPRCRPPPRVRASPSVREDPAGEHEPGLVLGPQPGERLEPVLVEETLREVELRLDVGLFAGRADRLGVAFRAEQEPDRLRKDRLAGAGLAGDRVQSLGELELGLANQDQVLDAQSAQHAVRVRSG